MEEARAEHPFSQRIGSIPCCDHDVPKPEELGVAPHCIKLRFLGEPASQGSKVQTKWGAMREVSKKLQPWRASIQYACEQQYKGDPITEPVALDVTFVFPRPKGHFSTAKGKEDQLKASAPVHYTKTPDLDKCCRALNDALTVKCGGNVLSDDSQVVELNSIKRYAEHGESTGALVSIRIIG